MGQTDYEKSYTDYYEEYLSKDESCVGERLSLLRKFQQALLNSGETLVAFETVSRELEKFRGQTSRELGLAYNMLPMQLTSSTNWEMKSLCR